MRAVSNEDESFQFQFLTFKFDFFMLPSLLPNYYNYFVAVHLLRSPKKQIKSIHISMVRHARLQMESPVWHNAAPLATTTTVDAAADDDVFAVAVT